MYMSLIIEGYEMNLMLFVLAACLLANSAYAQDDQSSGLNDFRTDFISNSTELPRSNLSLQMLIDNAEDGTTVNVPQATYALSQPLSIIKNITLVGSPFASIDGQGVTQILKIDNTKANVVVEKFLFTHSEGNDGGAIASQARSLTIKNCNFLDNLAGHGAGVYQKSGSLKIINSTFKDNKAIYWGTAVYDEGGDVQLENSTFDHNFGPGVIEIKGDPHYQANVLVKDCSVSNNGRWIGSDCEASDALTCLYTNALIDRCVFNNNSFLVNDSKACGINMVLYLRSSKVILNDTRIEENEGVLMGAIKIYGSTDSIVQMNRCSITGNHVPSFDFGEGFCDDPYNLLALVEIGCVSNVSMNDVIIEGNTADGGECCTIKNEGRLDLNQGTMIIKNSARQYSALFNTNTGVLNIGKDVVIVDNHDKQQPSRAIHSEGILNLDAS
jgi:hypothetical protein